MPKEQGEGRKYAQRVIRICEIIFEASIIWNANIR